jgi:hypothetical protein
MVCYTEPGLTEASYILCIYTIYTYIYTTCNLCILYISYILTAGCYCWPWLLTNNTRPLVREGASYGQDLKCQTLTDIWPWASAGARHQDRLTDWRTVSRNGTLTLTLTLTFVLVCRKKRVTPYGGAVEYLHRRPASRWRRRKWNPVPDPGGYKYRGLALQVGGVSNLRQ